MPLFSAPGPDISVSPVILAAGHGVDVTAACDSVCAVEAWRFVTATSVDELWRLLGSEDPSVILLALAVDGIPGRALCAEIRARTHRHRLAIVGLFEIDDSEYADALLWGFDLCVTPSMGIEALRSQLRAVVPIVAAGRQMSRRRGTPYSGPWRRRTDRDQRRTTQ